MPASFYVMGLLRTYLLLPLFFAYEQQRTDTGARTLAVVAHSAQTSAETTNFWSVALGIALLWLLSYGHLRPIPVGCW